MEEEELDSKLCIVEEINEDNSTKTEMKKESLLEPEENQSTRLHLEPKEVKLESKSIPPNVWKLLKHFGRELDTILEAEDVYCSRCYSQHKNATEDKDNVLKCYEKELSSLRDDFRMLASLLKPILKPNSEKELKSKYSSTKDAAETSNTPLDHETSNYTEDKTTDQNGPQSVIKEDVWIQSSLSHVLNQSSQDDSSLLNFSENLSSPSDEPLTLPKDLDTLGVAVRVRQTLAERNIGQRMFARHVLHLSQGTVSEMLAKPKPWSRLSHKSKESFTKMHHWVNDPKKVAQLENLMPKKSRAACSSSPAVILKKEDPTTVNRIQSILDMAQKEMNAHNQSTNSQESPLSAPVCDVNTSCGMSNDNNLKDAMVTMMDPSSVLDLSSTKSSHLEENILRHDKGAGDADFFKCISPGIEKSVLSSSAHENLIEKIQPSIPFTGSSTPMTNLVSLPSSLLSVANQDGNATVLSLDPTSKRFLGVLSTGTSSASDVQSNITSMDSVMATLTKHLNQSGMIATSTVLTSSSVNHNTATFGTPGTGLLHGNTATVTLTPIRCNALSSGMSLPPGSYIIATPAPSTSIISTTPSGTIHTFPTNSTSALLSATPNLSTSYPAILPQNVPVTKHTESNHEINTADLVIQVKDALSQHAISQRMFGDVVLGLSQGSVSDLLSRPKPWSSLTAKGREPFLRMKAFLKVLQQVEKEEQKLKKAPIDCQNSQPDVNDISGQSNELPANQLLSKVLNKLLIKNENELLLEETPKENQGSLPMEREELSFEQIQSSSTGYKENAIVNFNICPTKLDSNYNETVTENIEESELVSSTSSEVNSPYLHLWYSRNHDHDSSPAMCIDNLLKEVINSLPDHDLTENPPPQVFEELCRVSRCVSSSLIVSCTKKTLLQKGIGQRLLGKHVLNMCQASVSELLCRDRQWENLSLKAREPLMRLLLWLSSPSQVEKISQVQAQLRVDKVSKRPLLAGQSCNLLNSPSTEKLNDSNAPVHFEKSLCANMKGNMFEQSCNVMKSQPVIETSFPIATSLPSNTIVFANGTGTNTSVDLARLVSQLTSPTPTALLSTATLTASRGLSISSNPPRAEVIIPSHGINLMNATPTVQAVISPHVGSIITSSSNTTATIDTSILNALVTQLAQNVGAAFLNPGSSAFQNGFERVENVSKVNQNSIALNQAGVMSTPQIGNTAEVMNLRNVEPSPIPNIKSENGAPRRIVAAPLHVKRVASNGPLEAPDVIHKRSHISSDYYSTPLKRSRVVFSNYQRQELTAMFKRNPYPKAHESDELAVRLNLTKKSISNWFHNHRVRSKGYCTNAGYKTRIPSDMEDEQSFECDLAEASPQLPPDANFDDKSSCKTSDPNSPSGDKCEDMKLSNTLVDQIKNAIQADGKSITQPSVTPASRKRKAANPTRVVQCIETCDL